MPEHEFELYLNLLSRFLRLKPAQRDGIADELRDHLEQRLQELAAQGLTHEVAIRTALEEFGDAAELAKHFTRAIHLRRRRLIMRCTFGSVLALAAGLLMVTAFWPTSPHNSIPVQAVAQNPAAAERGEIDAATRQALVKVRQNGTLHVNTAEARIHASLDKPTEVQFQETSLEDTLVYLKEFHNINIWLDKQTLVDEGVSVDTPVTLSINGVSFRSVLRLLLEPLALTYIVEDEVMKVTTVAKADGVVGVYDIRDLAIPGEGKIESARNAGLPASEMMSKMAAGIGAAISAEPIAGTTGAAQTSQGGRPPRIVYSTNSVAELVAQTIAPETWVETGGRGLVIQYNGLLVVRNSQTIHDKVQRFLTQLRLAKEGDAEKP
ncbi:MAG: permease prefix domain 1-containing protein [Planctomycetales bacterium]